MHKNFEFKHPTLLDKVKSTLKYFPSKHRGSSLTDEQALILQNLRNHGYAFVEGKINEEDMAYLRSKTDTKFKSGEIDFPILAHTKIDPEKHKSLIDSYLVGTGEKFHKLGLAFTKDEFTSYEQVLKNFNPSTLQFSIPADDNKFYQAWLNPEILDIIEAYLGFSPKMVEAYVRRNFPSPYRTMNHFWHRDLNEKFFLLKTFIFLSDCELSNGPHEYVSGSHKDFRLNGKVYYDDSEVDRLYKNQIVRKPVKAGTILIEDTRGLHRAALPEYGYRDLGYAVFFPLPWFRNYKIVNYSISSTTYSSLSERQKNYLLGSSLP